MLSQLKVLLEDVKPTATLCIAMMEKLNAEEKLLLKVDEVKKATKSAPPPQPAPVIKDSRRVTFEDVDIGGIQRQLGRCGNIPDQGSQESRNHARNGELELFQMLKERKAKSFKDGIMTPITESQ